MGGFWSTLGQIGQGVGQGLLNNAAKQSPIVGGVNKQFQKKPAGDGRYQSPGGAMDPTTVNNAVGAAIPNQPPPDAPAAEALQPGAPDSVSTPQDQPTDQNAATASPYSPTNLANSGGGGSNLSSLAMLAMAKGGIVTKPTIARIGESGPEAVIPLKPQAGNKLQPDLLEGHISPPRVPGVHYGRYSSPLSRLNRQL